MWSEAEGLTELTKCYHLKSTAFDWVKIILYFGWLAVQGLNPDWLNFEVEVTTTQALR
jgi:hypothetical protein